MKRPQRRHLTQRERDQATEMERQRRRFNAVATFPQERLCQRCQTRSPIDDICPECWARIEEYGGV